MPFVPNRWMILRARFVWPALHLVCRDSLGNRQEGAVEWPIGLSYPPPVETEWIAKQAEVLVRGLPPGRPGPHDTGPVPLAVFLDLPRKYTFPRVRYYVPDLPAFSAAVGFDRVQTVFLAPGPWPRREPFRLPFRLLAGDDFSYGALEKIRSHSWLDEQDVPEYGFRIEMAKEEVEGDLRGEARDILVTSSLPPVLRIVKRLPLEQRPRLIVNLAADVEGETGRNLPPGVALLNIWNGSPEKASQTVEQFLMGLVHDLPLHEALKATIRRMPAQSQPVLIADPRTNQSLRIMDALTYLKRESQRRQTSMYASLPEVEQFLELVETDEGDKSYESFKPPPEVWPFDQIRSFAQRGYELSALAAFPQETEGLAPLAHAAAELELVRSEEGNARAQLESIVSDPTACERIREKQQREVDVSLERLETDPLLMPVERSMALQRGAEYQLRLHIGNRLPESIVTGPSAPIDPLLPDPDDEQGHLLEVAVQAKDFSLRSARVQQLRLPLLGGSDSIYFRVRTPDRAGAAELRILIFHRNHLVQSFLLRAVVEEQEKLWGEDAVAVRLEFSRTQEFRNLADLGPRTVSLGVNHTAAANTHNLTLKGDGTMGDITLFPSTFVDSVKDIREVLRKAVEHPANPNWTRVYQPVPAGSPVPADVADTIRSLAKLGSDLYEAFFGKSGNASSKLRAALVDLRDKKDQKIQVVRFDANFVFPWTMLYDYALPEEKYGVPPPDVCLGVTAGGECAHTAYDEVLCVKGFWGIRHYIEELIGDGSSSASKVERPAGSGGLRLVVEEKLNLNPDPAQSLTSDCIGPTDSDQLLDVLWEDKDRPAVLIVVGHLKTDNTGGMAVGEPTAPRIVLSPGKHWLTHKAIFKRTKAAWAQPRTVVCLLACGSAATQVTTVNDFITALHTAGANAVIGTECIVGEDTSADFAQEIIATLWTNKKPLGELMTSFRRRLLKDGNPLGFVFRSLGDVDLTVDVKS